MLMIEPDMMARARRICFLVMLLPQKRFIPGTQAFTAFLLHINVTTDGHFDTHFWDGRVSDWPEITKRRVNFMRTEVVAFCLSPEPRT